MDLFPWEGGVWLIEQPNVDVNNNTSGTCGKFFSRNYEQCNASDPEACLAGLPGLMPQNPAWPALPGGVVQSAVAGKRHDPGRVPHVKEVFLPQGHHCG